ncbi:serine/threonine-protein kinase [Streptomyces sp. BI20]|uniref:serine/threonine-protein kinase n=1 Tax=Streptomyces sp. BI20 TaxID=3403460 RepID=UPI003C74029B
MATDERRENTEDSGNSGGGRLLADRYRLEEELGRGGMGVVWRAQDTLLSRPVAVKELHVPEGSADRTDRTDRESRRSRLMREARAAAQINHPNVITVHDVLLHADRPWIVMELIDGESLEEAVDEGVLLPREAARIGAGLAAGLAAAHAAGVLHRDVKPANVFLTRDGRAVLGDFGIAVLDGSSGTTRTGEVVGSPDYLAPERVSGNRPGPASDLWSLGATLYAAVEGNGPFRRPTLVSTLNAILTDPPAPPTRAGGPLGGVLEALLAKDPYARPGAELTARALREIAETGDTNALAVPPSTITITAPPRTPQAPQAPHPPMAVSPTLTSRPAPGPVPPPPVTGHGELPGTYEVHGPPPELPAHRRRLAIATVVAVGLVLGVGAALWLRPPDGTDEAKTDPRPPAASTPSSRPPTTPTPTPPPTTPPTATAAAQQAQGGTTGGDAASRDSDYTPPPPPASDGKAGGAYPGTVRAGHHRVSDPAGFTIAVPDGWYRAAGGTSGQIDYKSPDGTGRLRIGVTPADPRGVLAHFRELSATAERLDDYRVVDLSRTEFRGWDAARWEFDWTEKDTQTYGLNHGFVAPDGKEYAMYITGPVEDYRPLQRVLDVALDTWSLT